MKKAIKIIKFETTSGDRYYHFKVVGENNKKYGIKVTNESEIVTEPPKNDMTHTIQSKMAELEENHKSSCEFFVVSRPAIDLEEKVLVHVFHRSPPGLPINVMASFSNIDPDAIKGGVGLRVRCILRIISK